MTHKAAVISTESRQGIMVNGVILKKGEKGNTAFGRIYTGDVARSPAI